MAAVSTYSKRVAISQSNYIPWKGYFDLINSVDEFILYDDMQFTRRDWRNRNKIKAKDGAQWLTIPVEVKGKYFQKISETHISDPGWGARHLQTIRANYARTPYFRDYAELFSDLYLNCSSLRLSEVNFTFLTAICDLLGIQTRLTWSHDYQLVQGKTERLVDLCRQVGAQHYVSGPSARAYIDDALFQQHGISVSYIDYAGYPEYSQRFPPFDHAVSIIDLLFNTGSDARRYMKSF